MEDNWHNFYFCLTPIASTLDVVFLKPCHKSATNIDCVLDYVANPVLWLILLVLYRTDTLVLTMQFCRRRSTLSVYCKVGVCVIGCYDLWRPARLTRV